MTGPAVPLTLLPGRLPGLLGRAAMLALVPVEPAAPWACGTAWEVARRAARLGRRTLLVDCFVDAPQLQAGAATSGEDGIVDAFEYGASLNRIAQRQPGTDLYFVPTGTLATDPAELLANPRWARLVAGFRHEGALLVLYVPTAALPGIVHWADAVIVLAREGFDFGHDAPGGLVEAEQVGKPMLVVTPGGPPAPPEPSAAPGAEAAMPRAALPFELVPDAAAADGSGLAFELVPDAGEDAGAISFDLAGAGAGADEEVTFDLPAEAAPDAGGGSLDLTPEPGANAVELPANLVPEAGGPDTGRISLQLPSESVWEPPPPPPKPKNGAAQPVGYAPTAFEEPPSTGFAPTAFDQPAPPPPPMPAAEELTTSAAEPGAAAESASQRPALRRTRPPMAELAAVRAPGSTRRTLLYAVGSLVAVWLTFVALRPEWVLPVGRPEATPPPPRPGAARLPDSLPWMVQVSAWNDLAHALEAMDTLAARGVRALVTPIRVDKGISYRVQAGPFATMGQAELVLDTLRAHSLADPDGSVAVPLPLSFVLGGRVGTAAADVHVERDSLRAAGVAAFLLAEPGGRLRLYAGAFERPDEAQVLDSILFTLGRARRLGPRVGLLP